MPARKKLDRIAQIIQILQLTRGAGIKELARKLAVSEMTVRRDLEDLARENVVKIIHAGAVLSAGAHEGAPVMTEEKMRIGRKAASLIDPGDIVIVDSGSTTEWLARSIPQDSRITVICFSLNVLVEARQRRGCILVFAGGTLQEKTLTFESPEGIELLRRSRAHKAFLSAAGVSGTLGVTCGSSGEAEMKRAALGSSLSRILLVDSRKFGLVSPAWFADMKSFDAIVSDTGISLEYVEIARGLGISLHLV